MKLFKSSVLKNFDWLLWVVVFLLIVIGLATIYSIGQSGDQPSLNNFWRQLTSIVIGLIALFAIAIISFRVWKNYSLVFYILGLVLLVVVLFFGTEIGGTKGWFSIFGFTLQPVEFAKVFLIIFLAYYFSRNQKDIFSFKKILISGALTGVYIILTLLQPDLGSALIMGLSWLGILLFIKTKKSHLLIIMLALIFVVIFSWFFVLQDYQKTRINTFFNPQADPLGSGYNVTQSIIAVGSGNLFGRGLGLGPQSQLNFLPTQETDFIFSVISEELGFVGSALIIVLFILFFWRLFHDLRRCKQEAFGGIFIVGTIIILFVQFLINVGMNIGVMPVTGLPLPFVSLAGTSMIVGLGMIGIIQSILINSKNY